MSETRAQALIDAGYYVAPAHGYALLTPDAARTSYTAAEAARGPDLNIYHGLQRDGHYLAKIDLDTHHAGQDADTARAALYDRCQIGFDSADDERLAAVAAMDREVLA